MILDVLNSDLIEKIIKIRTDDIERSILLLEEKLKIIQLHTDGLNIIKINIAYDSDDSNDSDDNDEGYFIRFGDIYYPSSIYLFESIINGYAIFTYSITRNNDEVYTIFSPIYKNPTMCMLGGFVNKNKSHSASHRNTVKGCCVVPKEQYEEYHLPQNQTKNNKPIHYIQLLL